ncbi:hypothetical protein LWI29_035355 [Acer saccharum]|uniref:Uncharacterized protein n=1 Tax=Acer saccharum TaxID=4024 RepID=A0AA39S6K5_ACESA|nr:hypothetical protein LWI29_035355 [Acer saccharum]
MGREASLRRIEVLSVRGLNQEEQFCHMGHDNDEESLNLSAEEFSTIEENEPEMGEHLGHHDHHFVVANNNHDRNQRLSNPEWNAKGHDHDHESCHDDHYDHHHETTTTMRDTVSHVAIGEVD